MRPSICLNMIVKDEAARIKRCLDSVRPFISYWVICDTESADDTCEIVKDVLEGIPGELHRDEFRNFAYNRNLGLGRSQGKADYHLMIDADMVLTVRRDEFHESLNRPRDTLNLGAHGDGGKGAWDSRNSSPPAGEEGAESRLSRSFALPPLVADGYYIRFEGALDYRVIRLVSDKHRWRYVGYAHEYIASETAKDIQTLQGVTLGDFCDGASRTRGMNRYLELLMEGLREEPENSRYVFYIAQTHREAGEMEQALAWYQRRAAMKGWEEERWYSIYQMARCKQALGRPWPEVLHAFLIAYEMRPWRLEPLLPICEGCRTLGQYAQAHMFSRPVLRAGYPENDLLFIERSVYQYALLMEHAIACYWVGEHEEAVRLNEQILQAPELPENYRISAVRNRDLSLGATGKKAGKEA